MFDKSQSLPFSQHMQAAVGCMVNDRETLQALGPCILVACDELASLSMRPGQFECFDFVMAGASSTPTGVLAMLMGDAAVYLLFDLRNVALRSMLELCRDGGRFAIAFKNVVWPLADAALFQALCAHDVGSGSNASLAEWYSDAADRIPALPALCGMRSPGFATASKHYAVCVFTVDGVRQLPKASAKERPQTSPEV